MPDPLPGAASGYAQGMRWKLLACATAAAALGVRLAHSRRRRSLHPLGSSFAAEVELWGLSGYGPDTDLLHRAGRYPATVRLSKGGGTPGGLTDLRGLAVRVHAPDGDRDLLYSTAGRGRLLRHVPTPRASFDTDYGSILAYRTSRRAAGKVYLWAGPEPGGPELGDSLDAVRAAAATGRARLLLRVADAAGERPFGRITLGAPLSADLDAALAFDPVRHTTPGLYPSGLIHGSRKYAYRASQWWRAADAEDQPPAPAARLTGRRR
jgi:hypothetical protein